MLGCIPESADFIGRRHSNSVHVFVVHVHDITIFLSLLRNVKTLCIVLDIVQIVNAYDAYIIKTLGDITVYWAHTARGSLTTSRVSVYVRVK